MQGNLWRRWLGNSAANIIGGLAGAGVSVVLPALVAKHLSTESFSVWNLALQIVVYVNLLSLGLQTATARAVAYAADAGQDSHARLVGILSAARSIARWSATAGLALVAMLAVSYPLLFPAVSADLVWQFRATLALFGVGAVAQILAQADMGVFQGLHQNIRFVAVNVALKLLTVAAVWTGVQAEQPMPVLATIMALFTAMLWPAMRINVTRSLAWAGEVARTAVDRTIRLDLLKYCGTLSVWSVSMLLINAVGIVIVGRIDFGSAGSYAIAMTAANVVVGLLGAALAPLMTTTAALNASEATRSRLPSVLTRSTLGVSLALNLFMLAIIATAPEVLRLWVGGAYMQTAAPLLVILVGAHCLRNVAAPYSLMLLGTGLHKRALVSAMLESVANVTASVVLGIRWGALGVACGSLVGSVVGLAGTLLLNTGRTPELTPHPLRFSLLAVVLPLAAFAPLHYFLWRLGIRP